jgi:peroxiredoxin
MRFAKILFALSMAVQSVQPAGAADVPRKAPEFAVLMPSGGQLLLSNYRGKVVCLHFIFTTCSHCQAEARLMTQLYAQYGAKGFQPIAVAFNEGAASLVSDFVKSIGVTYPVGYSPRESVMNYLQLSAEARLSVPQLVFIDRKGMIRQQSLPLDDGVTPGEANVRAMLEKLLEEPATSGASKKPTTVAKKAGN